MKFSQIKFLLPLLVFFYTSAYSLSPEQRLPNEKQEQRAMALFLEVRCLVCNGQVIENSDSEFSFQMRALIRDKISSGKSDEEIKEELIQKFGEDILVSSKYKIIIATLLILSIAAIVIYRFK
jgi:cytochrome c-type biogenesis protein CcmH